MQRDEAVALSRAAQLEQRGGLKSPTRRIRLCCKCGRSFARLDVHLAATHKLPKRDVTALLCAEKKLHRAALRLHRRVPSQQSAGTSSAVDQEFNRARLHKQENELPSCSPVTDDSGDITAVIGRETVTLDSDSRKFLLSFFHWLQSIDSGSLSKKTAQAYSRYAGRIIESLGGSVQCLQEYQVLVAKGGLLEKHKSDVSASTRTVWLLALQKVFAYIRLVAKTLPFQFAAEAEERVRNWMRNVRKERNKHRHVYAENQAHAVQSLASELPKFETLTTVTDGAALIERIAEDGNGRSVSRAEFIKARDFVMLQITICNAQRPAAIVGMKMADFEKRDIEEESSSYIIHVQSHKTSATYGSARLVLSETTKQHMERFVRLRAAVVPKDSEMFFCTALGKPLQVCVLSSILTDAFVRDGVAISDRNGRLQNITPTLLRKAHILNARASKRSGREIEELAIHMQHSSETQRRYYDGRDQNQVSARVHSRIISDSFRGDVTPRPK